MKRKIMLLICVILAIAAVFGACGTVQVKVGEMDGKPVYKDEFESWLIMMDIGIESIENEEYAEYLPEILGYFMESKVINAEVESRGYLDKLTSEQITMAEEYAQQHIDYIMQKNGQTEEEVLKSFGLTREELIEQYKISLAGDALFTDLVGDTAPTEEQIKQEYDSMVALQKESMDADPTQYVADVNGGASVYYVPLGVRMVRKLLIAIDAETVDAIAMLRDSGYDGQADILLADALSSIQSRADEIADKIKSGLSFNDAMQQYNEDTYAEEGGYAVVTGTTEYPDVFTEKAMALTSPGQISEIFATDEGYQIIEYTSDVAPGAVDYESIKERISEGLLVQVQTDAWTALVKQWKEDHNIKMFAENLKTTKASATPSLAGLMPAE